MSLASDWATAKATSNTNVNTTNSSRPANLTCGDMIASVMDNGDLHLDREVYLTATQALALETWLDTTYGSGGGGGGGG